MHFQLFYEESGRQFVKFWHRDTNEEQLCTDLPLLLKVSAHCDVKHHRTFMVHEFYKTRIIYGNKKSYDIFTSPFFEISYKILKQHLANDAEWRKIIC
jgi:hypothetical protein